MSSLKENSHSIWISCNLSRVVGEVIRWGEAPWWPKDSLMRFVRKGAKAGEAVREGTQYRQEVLLPFAPSWDVEVSSVTDSSITRRFLNGMFEGQETVSVAKKENGTSVVYRMHYAVHGIFNRILWSVVFRRLHDRNIEQILASLKRYLENK